MPGSLSQEGAKRTGREANHLPSCCSEFLNKWSCTSTITFTFTVCPETNLPLPFLQTVKLSSDNTSIDRIQPYDTLVSCT